MEYSLSRHTSLSEFASMDYQKFYYMYEVLKDEFERDKGGAQNKNKRFAR